MNKKFRRGFNLIEAAIVLGVAGLVIGAIWIAAATYNANRKSGIMVTSILTIAKNMQARVSGSEATAFGDNYALTAFVATSGIAPADMVRGSTLVNIYGGAVSIRGYILAPAVLRFDINNYNIPRADCIRILTQLSNYGAASAPEFRNVAGPMSRPGLGHLSTNLGAWASVTFPVSITTAETACSQTLNSMVATFGYSQ